MKEYRDKLKKALIIYIIITIAAVIMVVGGYLSAAKLDESQHAYSFARGFQSGLFSAWAVIMIYGIVKNIQALRSEKALKKMYIKEHDERTVLVYQKAKSASFTISILSIMLAAVVAGFYNITAFLSLLGVLVLMGIVGCGAKIFFQKKL